MDQFVATFHRFCGADQTFFVATLTSRPIGLETAFSIQLADKQPVLRGLCVVLDAWTTPENRYRRPGIRLGIKRLTAESQRVFDRLQAASRDPAEIAEATPLPAPPPGPAVLPLASGSPPGVPIRSASTPPPLPRLVAPRHGPPSSPPGPLPPLVSPRPAGAPPPTPPAVATLPPAVDARPPAVDASPPEHEAPAPLAVTRFQVALHVDGAPSPIDGVEFKPRQLRPRARVEPKIVSPPSPDDAAVEPGSPALIVDRPSEPSQRSVHDTVPTPFVVEAPPAALAGPARIAELARIAEPMAPMTPTSSVDLRTPGSSLVLPANPLHNLSDESIEGFVDCTLYEESGNFFHPVADDGDQSDEGDQVADPPLAPLATQGVPRSMVPAMPFDTAPNLTVQSHGNTESLTLGSDERPQEVELPRARPPQPPAPPLLPAPPVLPSPPLLPSSRAPVSPLSIDALFAQTELSPHASDAQIPLWSDGEGAAHRDRVEPPAGGASYTAPVEQDATQARRQRDHYPSYATAASGYAPHTAPYPDTPPPGATARNAAHPEIGWQRWLLIGGTAVAAIIVAFMVARLVRGSNAPDPLPAAGDVPVVAAAPAPGEPPARTAATTDGNAAAAPARTAATTDESAAAAPARTAATTDESAAAAPARTAATTDESAAAAPARTAATTDESAAATPARARAAVAEPAGSADEPDDNVASDDDGEVPTGEAPIVGRGPCRFTIATTPAGSLIRLDGVAIGTSPLRVDSSCDKHRVEASHARYQSVTQSVTLVAESPQTLELSLPRPIHAVTVTSFPPGAELSIDGRRAGTTPTVVQLNGFATVNLTFVKPGFQRVTRKVYSKLSQDRVFVKLMK